jgi:hypothetical protein
MSPRARYKLESRSASACVVVVVVVFFFFFVGGGGGDSFGESLFSLSLA